jgi:hypothetical protein
MNVPFGTLNALNATFIALSGQAWADRRGTAM